MKQFFCCIFLAVAPMFFALSAQDSTSVEGRLIQLAKRAARFNYDYTQEKVYLHFDNTGYFLGETIWFKAYVVKAENNVFTDMSKTLYVDLLTQEGDLIEGKKLKIENGNCHGEFLLTDSLKAGFYEVRAYTRCMLNFGEEVVFSRVFPVFDQPKTEGDYADRQMTHRKFTVPDQRNKAPRLNKINVSFYPEGGNLITGIESKIAFKATNKQGKSIAVTGTVSNSKGEVVSTFASQHDGMGLFPLFPDGGKYTARIQHEGKESRFDLPDPDTNGYALSISNLSPKVIRVMVQKSTGLAKSDSLALVLTCRGRILDFRTLTVAEEGSIIAYNKANLPEGVCQLTLYDADGRIRSERLLFVRPNSKAELIVKTDKKTYQSYEKIEVDLQTLNTDSTQANGIVSLSVRDGASSDFGNSDNGNLSTNLLLSSDLKGYIENPAWYFSDSTIEKLAALDLLMMVQGWRRYSWIRMEGVESFKAPHPIEEGILMDGKVLSLLLKKEMRNIEVLFWMIQGSQSYKGQCMTDEQGNFNFMLDMYGIWDLNLQTKNEDKRKEYRILLNRAFTPSPRSYCSYDKEVWVDNTLKTAEAVLDSTALMLGEVKYTTEVTPSNKEGYKEYLLKEVVKTKRKSLTPEQQAIKMASISYNVGKISDAHRDVGISEATDIIHMLQEENKYFNIIYKDENDFEYRYKARPVRFVLNNIPSELARTRRIEELLQDEIEKVLIVEDRETAKKYYPNDDSDPVLVMLFGFKDGKLHKEPIGIRKTTFQGYCLSKEFYAPVYKPNMPIVTPDYRRTLYWNPDVILDKKGKAHVSFNNNKTCKIPTISAEGLTPNGSILQY
jgi:hypothetical protein